MRKSPYSDAPDSDADPTLSVCRHNDAITVGLLAVVDDRLVRVTLKHRRDNGNALIFRILCGFRHDALSFCFEPSMTSPRIVVTRLGQSQQRTACERRPVPDAIRRAYSGPIRHRCFRRSGTRMVSYILVVA